jgi:tRNA-binding protein
MPHITWDDFARIELKAGNIVDVLDLGDCGIKKSSAQITHHYSREQLLGQQVLCVVNFPPKQIANFISEVLITGFADYHGHVVLATTERSVPNGARLF